jgi:dephospho-CoA kinase
LGGSALRTIGLSGKYCAGKDVCAKLFQERGFVVIDVDKVGHEVLSETSSEIRAAFGEEILSKDGKIDRKRLGSIVFADKKQLRLLESIVHPRMVVACLRLKERHEQEGVQVLVFNAALLHRMGLDRFCEVVCYVQAPLWVRFKRSKNRDGSTISAFIRRLLSQKDVCSNRFSGVEGVYVIKNSRDMVFIHRQVDGFCATMGI